MLRYSAHELAYDVSCKALNLIINTKIYDILINTISQQHLDLYYKKMIYEAFLPIAHQLVICRYDKKIHGMTSVKNIKTDGFPCSALLQKIWPDFSVNGSMSSANQIKIYLKDKLNSIHYKNSTIKNTLITFLKPRKEYSNSNYSTIAVNYVEGFDRYKRSDIFWLEESRIKTKSVIIYYENVRRMNKHNNEKSAQDYFIKHGIKQVRLWQWKPIEKNQYLGDLILELNRYKPENHIERWLRRSARVLCNKTIFWYSFFQEYKVKIHLDPIETDLNTIIKQMAINDLGGVSIGKLRSYPTNLNGSILGIYPNDIFFSWGNDSAKTIQKNTQINNILISGFPYRVELNNKEKKTKISRESKIKSRSSKFNILLLDSNHSSNENLMQVIDSSTMKKFYRTILDWVLEDDDLSIVIKPKKSEVLNELPEIVEYIDKMEQEGSCTIIKNSFQKMPNTYLNGIDLVVGISCFFPSAVIECVTYGARAIFYDYSNLCHHEPELYAWAENKVLFSNLEKMVIAVKSYKNNPLSNPNLGDWSDHLNDLDPYRDGRGGERIGTYMRWLQKGFDKGLDRDAVIDSANELYSEVWGSDKIYLSEKSQEYT